MRDPTPALDLVCRISFLDPTYEIRQTRLPRSLGAEALKSSCPQLSITGTVTNVCCESTARDAMMLDYRVTMLSDGNAALNDQEHAAALDTFAMFFGDVMTTSEAIARLQARDLVSIEHRKPAQREPIEYEVRS